MGNTNRTDIIRKEIFRLFIMIFSFSVLSAAAVSTLFIILNDKAMLIIVLSITVIFSCWAFFFTQLVKILRPMKDYTLLDSSEINRIIAKNTAPIRKKYYSIYNLQKEKDKKMILLRYNLERLYIKIRQDNKNQDRSS